MSRLTGNFPFSSNFEVTFANPLDARLVTGNLTDLQDGVTIVFPYSGMLVSVVSDSASTLNNGVYFCQNPGNLGYVADNSTQWVKLGSGINFTGNSWNYSANTLNLNYQGGTLPVTGFTFLNLSGGTVSGSTDGLLTISGSSNPLRIFGITGNSSDNNFLVWNSTNGNLSYTSLSAVTGGSYVVSAGTIYLSGTGVNSTISGFNYVTGFTVNDVANSISGYTNISGNTSAFGGIITAVTGGTFSNGNLYLSGSGIVSTGVTITGFGTSLSAVTGGSYVVSAGTIYLSGTGVNSTISGFNYVTGVTVSNNSISGITNTGDTSGGVITAITGGSYNHGTITFSGSGPFSSTVSGFNVLSGTGVDVSYVNNANNYGLKIDATNQNISFRLNDGTILSAYTGSLKDFYVTAGTYTSTTGVVEFFNTSGGSFEVSGFTSGLTNYYTTGTTYDVSAGIITFNRTDKQPAYSATGFNYVTGFTVSSANTISGYTNISGATVAFGGTVNAVTGGSFSNGTLILSGTGVILSGITGFGTGTGSAVITGGTDNYITKWSGTSALTISQIYDNGTNVGIGVTGNTTNITNKLHISASTNPLRIQGIQQSAQTQSSTKFLMIDNNDVVFWNNVTPTTGISIYITGFTSNFSLNSNKPVVDFIPSGATEFYRGASYQYLITANNFPTTRMGTLQGLWTTGVTPSISFSDVGPTQITNGTNAIINSIYFSAVTGGINVVVDCGGGDYTLKAYRVLL
jgi:hypothetical protein